MNDMLRLAIVTSHPIQYNAPLFRELASRSEIATKVFYSWTGTADSIDPEFGIKIEWDIPLLDGYEWALIPNKSADPGTHHFRGLDNPGMISAIESWGPEMVLVYGWSSRTHLRVLRHFKGRRPVLFRGDSTLLSATGILRRLFRKPSLRWIYRHVDLALYPGQRNKEYLRACGVREAKLAWMPHCVDNDRFAAGGLEPESKARNWRRALGIAGAHTAFLFAGKLVSHKQPDLLLQAFLAHASTNPESHLIFAGAGPMESDLRAMATNRKNIHFLGATCKIAAARGIFRSDGG